MEIFNLLEFIDHNEKRRMTNLGRKALLCLAVLLLISCRAELRLEQRAKDLCQYIPDVERLELSQDYMTDEFYTALDTMIHMPDSTPVLHEWEFWFCAADGTPIARCDCQLLRLDKRNGSSAEAVVKVQPEDPDYDTEEHTLTMRNVNGQWMIADFDGRLSDARRYIKIKKTALD